MSIDIVSIVMGMAGGGLLTLAALCAVSRYADSDADLERRCDEHTRRGASRIGALYRAEALTLTEALDRLRRMRIPSSAFRRILIHAEQK